MPLNLKGIPTTSSRGYDVNNIIKINRGLRKLPLEQRAAIIGSIIEESGGNPFAVDKSGTYKGLLQWGADRYVPKSKDPNVELNNQIQYILSTVNNTNGGVNWTHGGKGSGYKTLDDAYKTFNNQDLPFKDRFRAFSYGYVRPAGKEDSYSNRLKVAQDVLNRLVVGEQLSKPQLQPIPITKFGTNSFPHKYAEGGDMDTNYSYIDADNRRRNVLLHNDNGLLMDSNGNNYTQSYLDENNVPVIVGKMPRNTTPYFDPFGALTFSSAAMAPIANFTPSNIVGSIRKAHDYTSFMDSFMNQNNNGFFTNNYAKEHPYISFLGNMAGDMAIGVASSKAFDAIKNLPNTSIYRRLGYKANKLKKQLGLISRDFDRDGNFKPAFGQFYSEDYADNVFLNAFKKDLSKYGEYGNIYSPREIKRVHNEFAQRGFKTPVIYREGDTYYPMMPGDREYTLFSDNPEYYQFINETGLPPLKQSTVDKFLDRQMTSLRGVFANSEDDAKKFLTETEYGKVRSGGDRLRTKGGLYTSNSHGIAESFKNPNFKTSVDGYIGKVKMNDDIDRTLPIEQQLAQMRNKVFMTADNKIGNWTLDSRMRKKAIDDGAVAFESRYGRSNGEILDVTERVYVPTTENGGVNHPVTLENLDYYPNQVNKAGRWNTSGVDFVPEDAELFIPKQLNSTTDYIKYMREMLRKEWIPDEDLMNQYKWSVEKQANSREKQQEKLLNQARDAHEKSQDILHKAKIGATGASILGIPGSALVWRHSKVDEREKVLEGSMNIVSDYYLHGNKMGTTESRAKQRLSYLKEEEPDYYEYIMKRINSNSKAFGGSLNNDWDSLSYRDKAEMMKVAIANGITSLSEIRKAYNEFAKGGRMNWTMEDEAGYRYWRSRLPKNLRDTNDNDYDMRAAYKAGMEPRWNDEDKNYHLGSRDPQSGRILKAPHHPTFLKALLTDASLGYYPTTDNNGNTYTETWRGNSYGGGGYMPSDTLRKSIANWEGASMKTNRSFEAEARDFNRVIPSEIRSKLSSNQLDALYSYGYNVGMGKLKERVLPTLTAYTQGKATKEDVQRSMWATKDSQLRGLTRRRNWEREMFGGNYRTTFDDKNIGVHIDPTSFQLSQGFFNDANAMITTEIPQMQMPNGMNVDPSTLYKAPIIDDTLFAHPKNTEEVTYSPGEDRLEGIKRFNTIMGMMGKDTPLGILGESNEPGIMQYVNAIYS